MSRFIHRRDSLFPYQEWRAFPPEAIVLVVNAYGNRNIDRAGNLWWGYEDDCIGVGEGVIFAARRLDRPKSAKSEAAS